MQRMPDLSLSSAAGSDRCRGDTQLDDMVKEFLVEGHEVLDRVDSELVELEGKSDDPELLASIFRGMHTIKGTCGFLEFYQLEKVAHCAEGLLSGLRDRQFSLTEEMTTALLQAVDAIRSILGVIEQTGREGTADYSEICTWIDRLRSRASAPDRAEPSSSQGASSGPKPGTGGREANEDQELPALGAILINSGKTTIRDVRTAVRAQRDGDPRKLGEILVADAKVSATDVLSALDTQGETRSSVTDNCIRVDVRHLDTLMNLVGELVLARNQMNQHTRTYHDTALANTAQRLSIITSELQEGVMKTRMQPVGSVKLKTRFLSR